MLIHAIGKAINTFVALKEYPNGKATGISAAIHSAMNDKDDKWKTKTVALGTNGANVMVGQHGGMHAILKQEIPSF